MEKEKIKAFLQKLRQEREKMSAQPDISERPVQASEANSDGIRAVAPEIGGGMRATAANQWESAWSGNMMFVPDSISTHGMFEITKNFPLAKTAQNMQISGYYGVWEGYAHDSVNSMQSVGFEWTIDMNAGTTYSNLPATVDFFSTGDEVLFRGGDNELIGQCFVANEWGRSMIVFAPVVTEIAIIPKTLSGISIITPPTKTEYSELDIFDPTGMVITAHYIDSPSQIITDYTCMEDTLMTGMNSVSISYTENGITKTLTQPITVSFAQSKAASDLGGNPKVNLASGRLVFEQEGLSINDNSHSLSVSHVYNSQLEWIYAELNTGMGKGWKLNVQQYIVSLNGAFHYVDGAGYLYRFKKIEGTTNEYLETTGIGYRLKDNGNEYVMRNKAGDVYKFNGAGILYCIISRHEEISKINNGTYKLAKCFEYSGNKLLMYDRRDEKYDTQRYLRSYLEAEFNGAGRIVSISAKTATSSSSSKTLKKLLYTYSLNGELEGINKTVCTNTVTSQSVSKDVCSFEYTQLGKLKGYTLIETSEAFRVEYDDTGCRTSKVSTGYVTYSGNTAVFNEKTFQSFKYQKSANRHYYTQVKTEKHIMLNYYFNRNGEIVSSFETLGADREALKTLHKETGILLPLEYKEVTFEPPYEMVNDYFVNSSTISNNVNEVVYSSDFNVHRQGEDELRNFIVTCYIKHNDSSGNLIKAIVDLRNNGSDKRFSAVIDSSADGVWQKITVPTNLSGNTKISNFRLTLYSETGSSIPFTYTKIMFNPNYYTRAAFRTSMLFIGNLDDMIVVSANNTILRTMRTPVTIHGKEEYFENKDFMMSFSDVIETIRSKYSEVPGQLQNNYILYYNNGKNAIKGLSNIKFTSKIKVPLSNPVSNYVFDLDTSTEYTYGCNSFFAFTDTPDNNMQKQQFFGFDTTGIMTKQYELRSGTTRSNTESKTRYTGLTEYEIDSYGIRTNYEYTTAGEIKSTIRIGTDNTRMILSDNDYEDETYTKRLKTSRNGYDASRFDYDDPAEAYKNPFGNVYKATWDDYDVINNSYSQNSAHATRYTLDPFKEKILNVSEYSTGSLIASIAAEYEDGRLRTVTDGSAKYGILSDPNVGDTTYTIFDGNTEKAIHRRNINVDGYKQTHFRDIYENGGNNHADLEAIVDSYGRLRYIYHSEGSRYNTTYAYKSGGESDSVQPLDRTVDGYDGKTYTYLYDHDYRPAGYSVKTGNRLNFAVQQISSTSTKYTFDDNYATGPYDRMKTELVYDSGNTVSPRLTGTKAYQNYTTNEEDIWTEIKTAAMTYTYDGQNRVKTKYNHETAGNADYTYDYVTEGDITLPIMSKKTYKSQKGNAVNKFESEYFYDARGNVEVVKETKNSENISGGYNYARETTFGYDNANRLNSESTKENNTTVVNRTYTYNTSGNGFGKLNQITDVINGSMTKTFGYNGRGQINNLTSNGSSNEYLYDNYGNLSEKKINGVRNYTCSWTRGNLLGSVTKSGTVYGYSYNHKNIRFRKMLNGTTVTNFFIDGDRILGEKRSDETNFRYLYDADGLCGFADKNYNYMMYAYVKDSLGNISMITNENREILALYQYDPDGKCTVCNPDGSPNTTSTFIGNKNPFRWKCFYWDEETGFYYANCRYYDPETRQYIDAAEADVIVRNALELYSLNRNGVGVKSLYALSPYLADIYTSEEFSADPGYSDNLSWWNKYFLQVVINSVQILAGAIMTASGNPGGLLMAASGVLGIIGLACSDHIAQALGLTATAAQAVAASVQLLVKCINPGNVILAVAGFVAALGCVAFAAAEMQEGVTGSNYLRNAVGTGWYTGLMVTAQAVATTTIIYNQYGPKCFAAGTLVLTSEGLKKIEDIEVGDMVLSYDEETGEQGYKSVVQLFRNTTESWTTVSVEVDGKIDKITSTPGHKYYLPENNVCREFGEKHEHAEYDKLSVKWVSAFNLKKGDKVLLSEGKYGIVQKVETKHLDTLETTYNFEVEDFHTYYVGNQGVCVHNKTCDEIANELGYSRTNERSHGQSVYKNNKKKLYITSDVDGHNGGNWKMADSVKNLGSKTTRMGTYKTIFDEETGRAISLVRIGP